MVSKPDIERCASEEVEPRRGWTRGSVPAKDVGLRREVDWGIPHQLDKETSVNEDVGPRRGVDCEIPYRLGRKTKHSFIKV